MVFLSFALFSIDDEDESAATVDIVGQEQTPKEYTYPSNEHVSFCDLPGYGTPKHPNVEEYWQTLGLETFNVFLVFIQGRVLEADLTLIRKIQASNKLFFLVRTHFDEDIEGMKRKRKDQFDEEDALSEIRRHVLKCTSHLPCAENRIFLISNYDQHKWDFFRLLEAIMMAMPPSDEGMTTLSSNFHEELCDILRSQ